MRMIMYCSARIATCLFLLKWYFRGGEHPDNHLVLNMPTTKLSKNQNDGDDDDDDATACKSTILMVRPKFEHQDQQRSIINSGYYHQGKTHYDCLAVPLSPSSFPVGYGLISEGISDRMHLSDGDRVVTKGQLWCGKKIPANDLLIIKKPSAGVGDDSLAALSINSILLMHIFPHPLRYSTYSIGIPSLVT